MNSRKLKMYITIYENILLMQEPLIEYLSFTLPTIYKENWWTESVINTFKPNKNDNIKQKYEKEKVLKELINNEIKTLEYFDFSNLLDILIFNWKCININYVKQNLLYKLKSIRNDISHPNEFKLSSTKFKTYISYLLEFSKVINKENLFTKKLGKYVLIEEVIPKNEVSNDEKRIKILDLIEKEIIEPALGCDNLDDVTKESLTRTLIRFDIAETIEDMNAFFQGALVSTRGEEIYNILTKYELKTFENIRKDFNKIYNS